MFDKKTVFFFDNWYNVTSKSSPKIQKNFCFILIRITVSNQLKISDNKIKANQAQYDLDRLAAKTSAYSSGDLREYENLTGEDLGYKPSVKSDYSPLRKSFNKVLIEENKKEGLLKSKIFGIKTKSSWK